MNRQRSHLRIPCFHFMAFPLPPKFSLKISTNFIILSFVPILLLL
jgi:hypothetical protein